MLQASDSGETLGKYRCSVALTVGHYGVYFGGCVMQDVANAIGAALGTVGGVSDIIMSLGPIIDDFRAEGVDESEVELRARQEAARRGREAARKEVLNKIKKGKRAQFQEIRILRVIFYSSSDISKTQALICHDSCSRFKMFFYFKFIYIFLYPIMSIATGCVSDELHDSVYIHTEEVADVAYVTGKVRVKVKAIGALSSQDVHSSLPQTLGSDPHRVEQTSDCEVC